MEIFNYYFEIPSVFPSLAVTSLFFIIFVFVGSFFAFINNIKIKNIILFILSSVFIWSFSQDFYYLIVSFVVCIYGYIASLVLNKYKNKKILFTEIILLVIFLLIYKNVHLFNKNILIPLGISFYVLRLIWYLNQLYNSRVLFCFNPLFLFNYLLFFPCFSAGPIEKPDHFINQLNEKRSPSFFDLKEGWFRFLYGIFEKIVICDYLGTIVNRILPFSEAKGITVFIGILLYSFQIYLDFDSYSNIAIGVSKIFGLDVNENFKTPYLSVNIKEFWSRWHISLSTWLKDNIYIPLGGNQKGSARKIINICLVFIISGIWHGSTMNFLLWGLLHAIFRILEDILEGKIKKYINIDTILFKFIRILFNFLLVSFIWLIFKYDDFGEVLDIINRLLSHNLILFNNIEITHNEKIWLLILLIFVFVVDIMRYFINVFYRFAKLAFPFRYLFYFIGIVVLLIFGIYGGNYDAADFIYRWF